MSTTKIKNPENTLLREHNVKLFKENEDLKNTLKDTYVELVEIQKILISANKKYKRIKENENLRNQQVGQLINALEGLASKK